MCVKWHKGREKCRARLSCDKIQRKCMEDIYIREIGSGSVCGCWTPDTSAVRIRSLHPKRPGNTFKFIASKSKPGDHSLHDSPDYPVQISRHGMTEESRLSACEADYVDTIARARRGYLSLPFVRSESSWACKWKSVHGLDMGTPTWRLSWGNEGIPNGNLKLLIKHYVSLKKLDMLHFILWNLIFQKILKLG